MDEKGERGGKDEQWGGMGWQKGGHSDGASVEWELRDKRDIAHTIAHPWSLWNGLKWQLQVGLLKGDSVG